jgi:hypothetical protein
MRLPSMRSMIGNLTGLAVLGMGGAAFGNQIIALPSSIFELVTLSGSNASPANVFGWLISLPSLSTGSSGVAESAFAQLPTGGSVYDGGSYIPCAIDTVSTDQCWPTVHGAASVVITANNPSIPEPSSVAVLAIAVAAIAFAVARWRSQRDATAR